MPDGEVKTKKCVLPFKHRDKIYNNCIKIKEKGEEVTDIQLKCQVDVKGRNKFGTCIDQEERFLTEKIDNSDKGGIYVVSDDSKLNTKPSQDNEIYNEKRNEELKTKKKIRIANSKWEKIPDHVIPGEKIKEKYDTGEEKVPRYQSLEDAKKAAYKLNIDGRRTCDSIVQFNDNWFQLRKSTQNKPIYEQGKNLFVLESKKAIINSVVKQTKKASSVKVSENTSDEIWEGPYDGYGAIKESKSTSPSKNTLQEAKNLANKEFDDTYVILKDKQKIRGKEEYKPVYRLRKPSILKTESGKTIWIRKTKKDEYKKKFKLDI